MSYFRNPGAGVDEQDQTGAEHELLTQESAEPLPRVDASASWPDGSGAGFRASTPSPATIRSNGETAEHDVLRRVRTAEDEPSAEAGQPSPLFPLVRYGYSQADVDRAWVSSSASSPTASERCKELREQVKPPMSITEEIERIGEQTASILVVAHDQAHETTRRAQEQAERCIADAAANAVAITAEAKERLRELDDETDSVWRERERLLEDTRAVSERLGRWSTRPLARFPADADKLSGPMVPDRLQHP